MIFYNEFKLFPDEEEIEFLSATQAKKLTTLAITDRERKTKKEFGLWLEENKKNIREKIVEACGKGKNSINYQKVPADYYSLFTKYLNDLGYFTERISTYINGKDEFYTVFISWRY